MQLNKASKKTRKIADETKTAAPETSAAAEVTANPRTTRSSKTKKTEATETGSVKHRHNKGNAAAAEAAPAERDSGRAAAAGPGSIIVDAVGVVAPAVETPSALTSEIAPRHEATQEEIAKLAYSYWIARGYSHGGAQEDWLRAEQELRRR
jgi:hypothetical protein